MIDKIGRQFQNFFRREATSSIILFVVAVFAMVWANSPFRDTYDSVWQTKLGFTFGNFSLYKPLLLWINDGLMGVFFFLIGLEIKREIIAGELSTLKKASFPIIAAIGGMAFPIIIFITTNSGSQGSEGWGIPMATDIAFSLGILKLFGKRVPLSLKIFLAAFAIVDDIGAVLVIALFYSKAIMWKYLLIALGVYLILVLFNYFDIYFQFVYFIAGTIVWFLFLKSGVHPTLAGVILAFVIPANRKAKISEFTEGIKHNLIIFAQKSSEERTFLSNTEIEAIENIDECTTKIQPRLQELEHNLHGLVAYFIMPVFALANAGVDITSQGIQLQGISLNIALALLLGNSIGITLLTWIAMKLKLAELPAGLRFKEIVAVSFLGGFGFTMSLFISGLAYTDPSLINQAKVGIILGSLVSGVLGYILLNRVLPKEA